MGKEFPKLLQLVSVEPVAYKSREGGAIRLGFERNRFSYIHMATEEIYNLWLERIGRYFGSRAHGPVRLSIRMVTNLLSIVNMMFWSRHDVRLR